MAFVVPLSKAAQIRGQKQRQRGWKLYSWHAPETECIGKGSRSVGAITQPILRIFNGLISIFLSRREFSGQTGCAHRESFSTYIRKLP